MSVDSKARSRALRTKLIKECEALVELHHRLEDQRAAAHLTLTALTFHESQAGFSRELGVTQQYVNRIVSAKKPFTITFAERLSDIRVEGPES